MATLVSVHKHVCFACRTCGTLVTWWHNRNGKPVLVEVEHHPAAGLCYRTRMGRNKNLTPWHDCQARQRQVAQANEAARQRAVDRAKDEVARRYLPRLMEMAQHFTPGRVAESEALGLEYKAAIEAAVEKALAALLPRPM